MEILVLVLCAVAVLILVISFLFSRTWSAWRGRFRRRDGTTPSLWPAAAPVTVVRRDDDDSFEADGDGFDSPSH